MVNRPSLAPSRARRTEERGDACSLRSSRGTAAASLLGPVAASDWTAGCPRAVIQVGPEFSAQGAWRPMWIRRRTHNSVPRLTWETALRSWRQDIRNQRHRDRAEGSFDPLRTQVACVTLIVLTRRMNHMKPDRRSVFVATMASAILGSVIIILLSVYWPGWAIDWMRIRVDHWVYPPPDELALKVVAAFIVCTLLVSAGVLIARWLLQRLRITNRAVSLALEVDDALELSEALEL